MGVVGSYVFRDVVTVIDLARGVIALYAPQNFRPEAVRWLPTRMRPDVPSVEVKVEGRSAWLLLDTGMQGAITLFDPESATRLGLSPLNDNAVAVGSDGRRVDQRLMAARNVEFAGEIRQKVRVMVPPFRMAAARPTLQGLMGNQLLAGRTIVIDGPRRRVGVILT